MGSLLAGGALAGGTGAFVGILVSHLLGDVPASLLLLGTISSVVTGAIGAALGMLFARRGAAAAVLAFCVVSAITSAEAQQGATTKDFSWLAGRWEGTMTSGLGVADVTFAPPAAGLIAGVMRLIAENKILVVELISLVDTPDGPEMHFRHFSPELEAYETTFSQALRLRNHAVDKDVFENTVPFDKLLMSTQARVTTFERLGPDAFVGRTDILGADGKPGVVEVRYNATSVADILQAAHANPGSLYHYFPGKQDILVAVLETYLEGIHPMLLAPAWIGVDDPIERVFALLAAYRRALVATHHTYGCPIGSLALELHEPDPAVRTLLAANFDGWVHAIEQCFIEAGKRLPRRVDRRALATFALTTMEGGVMLARTARRIEPFDASVRMFREYLDALQLQPASRAVAKTKR